MSSFTALVQNENMKIYRRLRTWIMILGMVALMVTIFTVDKYSSPRQAVNVDWKQQLQQQNEEMKKNMAESQNERFNKVMNEEIAVNQYRIDHDLDPTRQTLWNNVKNSASFIMIVTILTIIVAGDMVASEFSWGTIKILLIRPASRSKILLSKYASTLIFSLLLLIILFAASFITGGILNGFGGVSQPDVYIGSDGAVHEQSMVLYTLKAYGYSCIDLLMMVTFAFMISSAFRSSTMSIGFSIALLMAGNIIIQILSKYSWVKYVLFANTNLKQYLPGGFPLRDDMTLGFSIAVLAVYFIAFNLISWLLFTRRDVAA